MMFRLPLSNRHPARDAGTALEHAAPLARRCVRRVLQALTLALLALAAWLLGPDGAAAAADLSTCAAPRCVAALGRHAPPGTFAMRRAPAAPQATGARR
jgi:hypothetical protein